MYSDKVEYSSMQGCKYSVHHIFLNPESLNQTTIFLKALEKI